ncbi:MAG: NAD(P)-dependent oxidoreductase [Phycisphaeraceae bacterium]
MTFLIVGATGATGRLLVEQLLGGGHHVRVIVRSAARLPAAVRGHANLSIAEAAVLDLSDAQLAEQVAGCDAVASCLGPNLSFRGIYGKPRRLVTDATRRLCEAVKTHPPQKPVRFVLMNTAGNRDRVLNEPVSLAQRCVVGLIRLLVPPHADNEQAADYLRREISPDDSAVQWSVVRPDTLLNEADVTPYAIHPSPTRSAIFNAGKTSRVNVAHFMAALMTEQSIWDQWRTRMPVIYNRD